MAVHPVPNPWMSNRLRLDQYLVEHGHYKTRARARDAVLRGTVRIDGQVITKPGHHISAACDIKVDDEAQSYVSRAALKLRHGLAHFEIDVAGRHAVDIGASTGGFTQVLLENGAASVLAIDVGHDQLDDELASDRRVTVIEGLNARGLKALHLSDPIEIIVCDVSFISLKLALPAALDLAEPGAVLIALIKPQFEIGRDQLGKGGVVRDRLLASAVCDVISGWLRSEMGWHVLGVTPSPIEGSDGNHEFLIAAENR